MPGLKRDGRPGWDPEHDAEDAAAIMKHIPTVEDDYERWGVECELKRLRAWQHSHCGRRWPGQVS